VPLLDANGTKPDIWVRPPLSADGETGHLILPFADIAVALAARAPRIAGQNILRQQLGTDLPNNVDIEAHQTIWPELGLIAIAFPSFGDGRGFSLARRLRRSGFTGILRASGPLIADQLAYALACGFDEVELSDGHSERQPVVQWLAASRAMSGRYQRGYEGSQQIIPDQRRAMQVADAAHAGGRFRG
jgi:uncharacterized protein (DUF934 family)